MNRGLSTPLDVAVGLLLVGAAVGVISGIQPPPDTGTDVGGSELLGSTVEVEYADDSGPVRLTGTIGGLLAEAVAGTHNSDSPRASHFRAGVRAELDARIARLGVPIQLVGFCRGSQASEPLVVGGDPPAGGPIRAVVYPLPSRDSTSAATSCRPAVVVRRWSV